MVGVGKRMDLAAGLLPTYSGLDSNKNLGPDPIGRYVSEICTWTHRSHRRRHRVCFPKSLSNLSCGSSTAPLEVSGSRSIFFFVSQPSAPAGGAHKTHAFNCQFQSILSSQGTLCTDRYVV
ncbi:hypothetical protein EVAR_91703_1 [Eumeta japonica]|uniref:Uncharacterized protein n=1 Tax=Eumeta variegata TaxID=151549 RepID=A0A4C2ACS2_EUMVA|nr:hypothetical protein EVAR_91703_1 [Eumeta japonica]